MFSVFLKPPWILNLLATNYIANLKINMFVIGLIMVSALWVKIGELVTAQALYFHIFCLN